MKKLVVITVISSAVLFLSASVNAQQRTKKGEEAPKTEAQLLLEKADSADAPLVITLDQALQIALSENVSVKVADKEIERTQYAKKGTYASLFPQIDISGAYQRTIKKQVMYMDFDMSSLGGVPGEGTGSGTSAGEGTGAGGSNTQTPEGGEANAGSPSLANGMEVGRWNTWSAGVSAAMPIVNAQLWESIKVSGKSVELAVEKARASRLDMVSQVKNAYFATLLAKEAFDVYKQVYENAVSNYEEAQKKFNAQKASELELARAKTTVANAIPNVYSAESNVILSLWQLKAVMGVDLDLNIDVDGALEDYSTQMMRDINEIDSLSLSNNTTMRQLAIQAEQLASSIRVQKFANIPTLSLGFNFSLNAMTNDFNFSQYRWTPYSYVGLSLSIPVFAGGKRYQAIRQAKNQYEQVQLQTTNTERQLKIAIRQSLNTMETNMKTYYSAIEAVNMAQKAYDIAEKSYQVGRSTLIELNDAQLALTQAKLAQSQAIYSFVIAKAQLENTLGQDFIEE